MHFLKRLLLSFLLPLFLASECTAKNEIFIRVNQLGFLVSDAKLAVVLSNTDLKGKDFSVVESVGKIVAVKQKLGKNLGTFGYFNFVYKIDFSNIKKSGKYKIIIENKSSEVFKISNDIYAEVVDTLMQFYKVQRCGYTDPAYHKVCHKFDATELIDNGKVINEQCDVTGGWHDAADYVKFLNTTAYTTYTLLFAYGFDSYKFGFDNDKNGTPDILEEAKIGLDWLLRCNYKNTKLITQVQGLEDHEVGWRMPEDDPLETKRPAYLGIGKNLIGIYSATLALANRIWIERFSYNEFADKCLTAAENIYSLRNMVQDVDTSGTGHYRDSEYKGKLALAAVEMYMSTNNEKYLAEAEQLAMDAGSDYWWSWGNVNSYAHYRLANIDSKFTDYLENGLKVFSETSSGKIFGAAVPSAWGSNNTMMGIALQAILYKRLTNRNTYDSLATIQRDYILGRNQWGVSFIEGIGKNYSRNFHHQIPKLKTGRLPGGFAAGPVTREYLDSQNIPFEMKDRFQLFQTDDAVYRDDRMDFITNEPTISANATAIFVMGFYSKR